MPFEVIPAVDVLGGRVVRLREGDYDRETRYSDDPAGVAESFAAAGARWIHLVDLDGSRGEPRQTDVIAAIVARVDGRAACQVGGGIRTAEAVAATLAGGASRVVLGTAFLAEPALAAELVRRHGPERIAAALDIRDGRAVGSGWHPGAAGTAARDAHAALADAGIEWFVVTAIARDGALEGPDLGLLRAFIATGRGSIVASAGIASIADILAVRDLGCAGAIVGRAIYEGRVDLAAALEAVAAG